MNTHIFDSWHLPHLSHRRLDLTDKEDLKMVAKFTLGVFFATLLMLALLNAVFGWDMPFLPHIG